MRLDDLLTDLFRRQAETERRLDNMHKHGRVEEVDAKARTVRLRIGGTDDQPLLSPHIPYAQFAGALKVHTPPSKGQQMTLLSPTGDFRQAIAMPFTWTNSNPSPSEKPDENVMTFGDWRLTLDGEKLEATKGETTLRLTGESAHVKAAKVTVESADVSLGGEGGKQVARIGDRVQVGGGSSAGLWPIVEGSGAVTAVD